MPVETVPSLDLRRWAAPTDPEASPYLEPAATPGHLAWNVGVWGSYAYRPLELENPAGETIALPILHQISVDYVAAFGLTDRLALGVALPTVVYQQGNDLRGLLEGAEKLPTTALGDLALTAKATLMPPGDLGGFAIAALARVSLPTGDAASYVSESTATGEFRLLGELSLVALALRATGGVLVRGAERRYAQLDFGHELPWGAGLAVRPQAFGLDSGGHWQWNLEAHGALSLTPGFAKRLASPASISASARYEVGHFALTAGAELPLTDAVGNPRWRGLLGLSYAPRFPDVDGDGINDDEDECAELAEDLDGHEDGDGCPDFDNDDDGVPDESDKCPREQEDSDGVQDEDGCPDLDNDHDGVPDKGDQCPDEPGNRDLPGAKPGCPSKDGDVDGIPDPLDRCPAEAEDRDAHQDEDGCPDPDNDNDDVPDQEDACPKQPGPSRADPAINGCPSPDKDGDTFDNAADRCPEQREDFDGNDDADGCADPEPPAAALARFDQTPAGMRLILARPVRFDGAALAAGSEPVVRAIAALLNQHPERVVLVAARPAAGAGGGEQIALNRSFAVVEALRRYTHRDEVAETIGWSALRKLPGAGMGELGFLVLAQAAGAP